MKEQNSYFSHDGNARNDSKVLKLRMRHGAAGYGVYFMILERLREEDGYVSVKDYNMIAFDLRVDANLVKSVVEDFGLFAFTEDGECFYSESFNRRMSVKDEVKKARSEAGKKGGAPAGNNNALKDKNKQKQANGCFETSKNEVVFETEQEKVSKPAETDENKQINSLEQAKTSKCLNENKQKQANGCFETSKENKGKERKIYKKKESKEKVSPRNVFHAPTLMEVEEYIREKDLTVDAERFMAYYESNGWMVGRNKMKSWRAALCMWQARDKPKDVPKTQGAKPPVVVVPSAEDEARERAEKAETERRRVLGIYESARQGNRRMQAIVAAWAENGTLAQYGLEGINNS